MAEEEEDDYNLQLDFLPEDLKLIHPRKWTKENLKTFLCHRFNTVDLPQSYLEMLEKGLDANSCFNSDRDTLKEMGFSVLHSVLLYQTKGPAKRRKKTEELSTIIMSKLEEHSSTLRFIVSRVDGLDSKVQSQQGLDARLLGSRRSTTDWAQEINSCACDHDAIDEILQECDMQEIEEAWNDLLSVRTKLAGANAEDGVQDAVFQAGTVCGESGHLRIRDTHLRLYPEQPKIDLTYTPLSFPESERVILSVIITYGELKFGLDTPTVMQSACTQIHDRIVAIQEAQFNRHRIMSYIADKNVIRIFRYDERERPGPFISTKCLPFLTTDTKPTDGFALFHRLHRSTPEQLGFPDTPICPGVTDPYYVLRTATFPKACIFVVKRGNGERLVAKVYTVKDQKGARQRFQNELDALQCFNSQNAPVPSLVSYNEENGLILLKPYGKTLKDCVAFDEGLFCKVANAAEKFLRVAQTLEMVHRDISPENIIIGPDDTVVINDLGSCSRQGAVNSMKGSNLVLCCPVFGSHFEESSSVAKPFEYTLMNDIRAVFISLFAYSLKPREREDGCLAGKLPWEGKLSGMQSDKATILRWHWTKVVVAEALPLLRPLWSRIFIDILVDDDGVEKIKDVESILSCLQQLSPSVSIRENADTDDVGEGMAAVQMDALSIKDFSSLIRCTCGKGQKQNVCSDCRCSRNEPPCSHSCHCKGKENVFCYNPYNDHQK